jgi:glyoxylase-like metal-dependent hydrolase (beta-lactamase superfamily II)
VLHTPGHSDGHVALWDAARSALVIGDATLGETVPTADGAPAFPPTYRDTDPYLASIEAFRSLEPELLLTAHYPVYEGAAARRFLDASAEYTGRLDAAIGNALREAPGGLTSLDIIRRIAPGVGDWSPAAADYLIFPVTGNLERLARRGLVRENPATDGERRTWAWSAE